MSIYRCSLLVVDDEPAIRKLVVELAHRTSKFLLPRPLKQLGNS